MKSPPFVGFDRLDSDAKEMFVQHKLNHYDICISEYQRQAIIAALKAIPPDMSLATNELEKFSLAGLLDSFEKLHDWNKESVENGEWNNVISFVI